MAGLLAAGAVLLAAWGSLAPVASATAKVKTTSFSLWESHNGPPVGTTMSALAAKFDKSQKRVHVSIVVTKASTKLLAATAAGDPPVLAEITHYDGTYVQSHALLSWNSLLKGDTHAEAEAALRFVNWWFEPAQQVYWAEHTGYPPETRAGVAAMPKSFLASHPGEAALELMARARFDVVVLDLLLPGVDGFEVCRRLRQERRWVPVVMVTALGGIDDRLHAFELGADDYLVKPFVLQELVARLHVVLRHRHRPGDAFLTAADLRLDVVSRRAFRGTAALDLTPREFDLLELLVRHADIVVTRQTILIALWGRGAAVSKNVVDQYVAHLRKKVDRPFGRCDLETVYVVGWRLRIPEAR